MNTISLCKEEWAGNHWPAVGIQPYEEVDFLKVLFHLCIIFDIAIPKVVDILDGYTADITIDGSLVIMMMDNWTFSIASDSYIVRDKIYDALRSMER